MVQRRSWNLIGLLTAASIIYFWLCVFVRKLPTPPMSGSVFLGWFFGSLILFISSSPTSEKKIWISSRLAIYCSTMLLENSMLKRNWD